MGRFALSAAVALVALALVDLGCAREPGPGPEPIRAFYHWRTTLALTAVEQRALLDLGVTRLYLRFFDVVWEDGAARPVSPLIGEAPPPGVEVVPVVFIREAVFRHATADQRQQLADRIRADVAARSARLGVPAPRELQLDCDWTDGTRDAYFDFLRRLGAQGTPLSATIRLHQIKYRERTGVPPVSRGMLMFYNMGDLHRGRSIFDAEAARAYLGRLPDYPLPLDAALPIWSWAVHRRDDHVEGLLQSLDPGELPALSWLAADGAGRYRATETTFLRGSLVREGDVIEAETIDPATAREAAELLAGALPTSPDRTVTLFDLSPRSLARHDTPSLDQLFRIIR